MVIEEIDDDVF